MNLDLFYGITNNAVFLLSLVIIFTFIPDDNNRYQKTTQVIIGFVLSAVLFLIMTLPFEIEEGILLDTRSILIGLTTLFLGFIPGIITVVTGIIIRLYTGGPGTTTGIATIITSGTIGLLYRHYRIHKISTNKWKRGLDFYFFGLLVHCAMVCTFYFLPKESRWVIDSISLYVLILFPLITLAISSLLYLIRTYSLKNKQLAETQQKFVNAIQSAPVPIALHNEDGNLTLLNNAFTTMTGYSLENTKTVEEFMIQAYPDRIESAMNNMYSLYNHEKDIITGDLNIKTLNKRRMIWDIHSSSIGKGEDGKEIFISIAKDVTKRKDLEDELKKLSFKDELTGLYNKRFYNEELKRMNVQRNYPLSLLVADVNSLKLINDSFGHNEGDILLIETAKAIQSSCREDDIVCRIGGDEFVVILPKTDEIAAQNLVDRINKKLQGKQVCNIDITVSLGYHTSYNHSIDIVHTYNFAEKNMYQQKLITSKAIKNSVIDSIMQQLLVKDHSMEEHMNDVSLYSVMIAEALGLDDNIVEEIKKAGLLHDIGKIVIPYSVLNSSGNLSILEREDIQKHPETGYRILSNAVNLDRIAQYTLSHHEWYNGKGYPQQIKGTDIPLESRILSVADAYSAMTSARSYRPKPFTKKQALDELTKKKGTQFDPDIVDVFVELMNKEV